MTTKLTNYSELTNRIQALKDEKILHEAKLKNVFEGFANSLNPVSMIKDSIHSLAGDKVVRLDLAKAGLNLGANFLIEQVIGRNRSIKGFLTSIVVEKFSTLFINKNGLGVIAGIKNMLLKKPEQENQITNNNYY